MLHKNNIFIVLIAFLIIGILFFSNNSKESSNEIVGFGVFSKDPTLKIVAYKVGDEELVNFMQDINFYKNIKNNITGTIYISLTTSKIDACAQTLFRKELERYDIPEDLTYLVEVSEECWNINFGQEFIIQNKDLFKETFLTHELLHVWINSNNVISIEEFNLFDYSTVIGYGQPVGQLYTNSVNPLYLNVEEVYVYNLGINYFVELYGVERIAKDEDLYKILKFLYQQKISYGVGLKLTQELKDIQAADFDPKKYKIFIEALKARESYNLVEASRQ